MRNKLFLLWALLSLCLGAAAQGVTIYGHMTTSDSFDFPPSGVYRFDTGGDLTVTPVFTKDWWYSDGGCVFLDGKYYDVNQDDKKLYVYDTSATPWAVVSTLDIVNNSCATDLTYDITSNTVYGCFYDDDGGYVFGTLDLATGVRTKIADLPQVMETVDAGSDGTIYAIGLDLNLYKIDKQTGALTLVGATGIDASQLTRYIRQSAAFDLTSNTLYWCFNSSRMGLMSNLAYLYTVDISTGKATLVKQFPNNEMFIDIYIPQAFSNAEAPAPIADLRATFETNTGKGRVSFTIPTQTATGKDLKTAVEYTAMIADDTLFVGKGDPGETVERDIEVNDKGKVELTVTLASAPGKTSTTTTSVFIGNDTPVAVSNISLKKTDGGTLTLTWNAPTAGANGGYLDTSNLTYRIVRQPGGKVVADNAASTTFTENLADSTIASVYYDIVPHVGELYGEKASSSRIVVGRAYDVPYKETFDSEDNFLLYTVNDVTNDGKTWSRYVSSDADRGAYATCDFNTDQPKDDWLFTPPVHLRKGSVYTLSFKASSRFTTKREKLAVSMGTAPAATAMKTKVMDTTVIDNDKRYSFNTYKYKVTVDEDNDYYIGFHAVSDADEYMLDLDDISIEGASEDAPQTVTDLKAKAAANGELSADISFTTPGKTLSGKTLASLERAEVYSNGKLAGTIERPETNKAYTVTVATAQGTNVITVVTSNAGGESLPASTTVYTGLDAPAAPKVSARLADGKPVITWTVDKGFHDGYINPADMTYTVYRFVGDENTTLATGIKENIYTDDYQPDVQTVVTYAVVADNSQGYGDLGAATPLVFGGTPYELPFYESFENGFTNYSLWGVVSNVGTGVWTLWKDTMKGVARPFDGDNGSIVFMPMKAGDDCRMFSGNISLKHTVNPTLEFWYYNRPSANVLKAQINVDNGGWQDLKTIPMSATAKEGWTKVSLPLAAYSAADYVSIGFDAVAAELKPVEVDHISVRNILSDDLSVSLKGHTRFEPDKTCQLAATVKNMGQNAAGDYTVNFYLNGDKVKSVEGPALQPDSSAVVMLDASLGASYPEANIYVAKVEYAPDKEETNNTSNELKVRNVVPNYPAATNLTGTLDGSSVKLSWKAPAAYTAPDYAPVTDSFEDYEPFAIDDIGDWTLVDVDGEAGTFGLLPMNYPYRGAAKSFQVFSARALNISTSGDNFSWKARTGDQMLAAFADADRKNDDWLISPPLSGKAQTLKFYVRSVTSTYGLETYEVMASQKGKNLTDFVSVARGEADIIYSAGQEWTEVTVNLPEGTNYFAIRCTSEDRFCMVLDDVTYTPGDGLPSSFTLAGYNVYRDNVKLNDEPVTATTFSDVLNDASKHYYSVSAVYTTGESRCTAPWMADGALGVDKIASKAVSIKSGIGHIAVEAESGSRISVYAPDGALRYTATASADKTIVSLQSGVYIVRVNGKTAKVTVR